MTAWFRRPDRTSSLIRLARAALLVAPVLAGCAEERAPINRVQPNALAKAFFVGDIEDAADDPEFYMRTTVIDVSAGAGSDGLFTSSDAQPTTRVRFEITEKLLVARLTYELVDHTDGKGVRRTPDGQVVAAYAIDSHFDIRRDYNDSTGENSNVIIENTSDRPWDKRDYMRVDWSRNLITDAYELDALSQLGIYYGVVWDPVAYYVNDPESGDAPVFDVDGGYFDVTHKAYASPQVIHDEEWGDYPACWLIGSWPLTNCNPSEVTLRQAFKKVTDTDYEPLPIDGTQMDMFGYFTMDRFGYDRRYGVVDDSWRRFATRWNFFERSHVEDAVCNTPETTPVGKRPNRDEDQNGTEDECESVGRGSRCDAVVGECTIPLRDRTLRPVVWHVNADSPPDLFEGSKEALEVWNDAMRVAILAGELNECRRTGEGDCEATLGWPAPWHDDFEPSLEQVPDLFVLCHNPVDPAQGDPEACGEEGTAPRLGDLRYNFVNIVADVEVMSPWGIMMDAEDPLTGEKIAGSVNEWSHVLDRAASNLVDVLGLLNGEIAADEFLSGQNVSDWVAANTAADAETRRYAMSKDEIASRRGAFDPEAMRPYFSGSTANTSPQAKRKLPQKARHEQRVKELTSAGKLGPGNGELSARLRALRGTPVEAALASPEMHAAVGIDPSLAPTPDSIRRASPFGHKNPTMRKAMEQTRRGSLARRHSCRVAGPEAEYLLGLAKRAQAMFPAPDPTDPAAVQAHRKEVYDWARRETSKGVMAHELGHSMGLRHNFAASFDSFNYALPYWQLRTKNGEVTTECADGEASGDACIGPRWRDPITQFELDGNINRYATTSVMDYPGDQNQDMLTAGTYDKAALRFGYGGVVDVFAEDGVTVDGAGPGKLKAFELSSFTTSPGLFGIIYFNNTDVVNDPYHFYHYSTYQKQFGVLGTCSASDAEDAVLGQKCTGMAMDVVDYRDTSDFAPDPDYAKFDWANQSRAKDTRGRVRRGYMFSSDEYADTGNVPSFSDDAGADAYEQIRFLESAYENRYIFDAFRRDRVMFNADDVTARVQAKYLDNIQLISKAFAFGAVLDGDPTQPTDEFLADGLYGPLAMGASVAFDMYARTMTRAEPGLYCDSGVCGTAPPPGVESPLYGADTVPQPELYLYNYRIGLGDGRYLHNDYDYSQGYFWGDYQTQVGTYYDKVWAIYYLAEAFDSFISNSKEDYTDSRYKNVNFATIYPKQMRRLFSSLMTNDYDIYAPWVEVPLNGDETPDGTLIYPTWHDPDGLGTRPATAQLADPNYGWNNQLYAMVWGTMFFPTNWSQDFVNDARITVKDSDQVNWPAAETLVFYDPVSGLTYRAHTSGTETLLGQVREKGTGARMLAWANRLLALTYLVTRDVDGNPVLNPDGTMQLILDVDGKPQLDPARPDGVEQALRKYVDSIDLFRQLTATFEQPLGDGDLPQP